MRIISYWWLPIVSGFVWLGTLLGLLIYWVVDTNRTHYDSMGATQTIAYISDVGASELKPLFVAGCIITTIFLDLSFGSDRWLRHKGRLVPNTSMGEKVLSGLTIFFALIGTVGLTCLSGFDTAHYPRLHDVFLLLFIAGYLLSAIFICWEYQRLGIKNREHRVLRISFWIKLTFVLVELVLAIAFIATNFLGNYNAAAILEWAIAFIFSFYVFSFVVDLYPASRTGNHIGYRGKGMNTSPRQMEEHGHHHHGFGGAAEGSPSGPRFTQDSHRPLNGHAGAGRGHTNF